MRGNDYMLVAAEAAYRATVAVPQRGKTSLATAQSIRSYIVDHGIPVNLDGTGQRQIITFGSDDGSEFRGEVARLFQHNLIRREIAAAHDHTGGWRSFSEATSSV
jgi:hypothetical protein